MNRIKQATLLFIASLLSWVLITTVGYGPQSLANLVEVPIVVVSSIVLFFVPERFVSFKTKIIVAVVLVALLRTFMPVIPE